uniref:Cnidarian restricted protein n=1 Tax=Clytia hemisphaerica TaxID=252671 RepID=A0A7M5USM3_9CNID
MFSYLFIEYCLLHFFCFAESAFQNLDELLERRERRYRAEEALLDHNLEEGLLDANEYFRQLKNGLQDENTSLREKKIDLRDPKNNIQDSKIKFQETKSYLRDFIPFLRDPRSNLRDTNKAYIHDSTENESETVTNCHYVVEPYYERHRYRGYGWVVKRTRNIRHCTVNE